MRTIIGASFVRSWLTPRTKRSLMSMTTTLEREVKLRFDSVEVARKAVLDAGATPLLGRRLQEDSLLDTDDEIVAATPMRAARARRERQEPDYVQGSGPAVADEAARRARDDGGRWPGGSADSRGAGAARLVPVREIPRRVLARERDGRDRRNARRRVRRDRGQRAGHHGDGRRARAHARPTTCSIPTAGCSSDIGTSSA